MDWRIFAILSFTACAVADTTQTQEKDAPKGRFIQHKDNDFKKKTL